MKCCFEDNPLFNGFARIITHSKDYGISDLREGVISNGKSEGFTRYIDYYSTTFIGFMSGDYNT